ncbi:MAG: hypothetical protein JW966_13100 [Anaerolineae bacterium]|nr:hypothetical protein [Anaerolineae bacterium]
MVSRRLGITAFITVLIAISAISAIPSAVLAAGPYLSSVSATCTYGTYVASAPVYENGNGEVAAVNGGGLFKVSAYYGEIFLGSDSFDPPSVLAVQELGSGMIVFNQEVPEGARVDFILYIEGGMYDTKSAIATGCAKDVVPPDVRPPGCGALDGEPGAVVGQVLFDQVAFWAPKDGAETHDPPIVISPNKTLWVYGLDSSAQFWKVSLGCAYLWVPVGSMGPNPDNVWHNTGLPSGREVK